MIFIDFELQPKLLNVIHHYSLWSYGLLTLLKYISTSPTVIIDRSDYTKQLIRADSLSLRTEKWTYSANLEMRRALDLDVKVIRAVRPDYIPFNHQL